MRLRLMATSARMTVSRSAGPNVASARSVSLSVSAAMTRPSWDEATFEAIASILPEVHAIEPKRD